MTVQKDAESNAESIDPADVPVNTFWLIEFEGKHYEARRIPWPFREHHWSFMRDGAPCSAKDAEVTLVSRLVPAPRVITNPDELERAKRDTIIRDARGVVCSRDSMGHAWSTFTNLAEELRHIAEHWEEWATDTITSAIRAAADRAEQTEQENQEQREWNLAVNEQAGILARERDEARAAVERLTAELDREKAISKGWMEAHQKLAEHHAETLERAVATVASEENVTPDQQANTQGILAGSLPDPADVKPGEAWLIRVGGREALAVRDGDPFLPWFVAYLDGGTDDATDKSVTLVSRLVPAPRVINSADELDRLPRRAVILSTDGQADVYQKDSNGEWLDVTSYGCPSRQVIRMENAVTVLWEPEA